MVMAARNEQCTPSRMPTRMNTSTPQTRRPAIRDVEIQCFLALVSDKCRLVRLSSQTTATDHVAERQMKKQRTPGAQHAPGALVRFRNPALGRIDGVGFVSGGRWDVTIYQGLPRHEQLACRRQTPLTCGEPTDTTHLLAPWLLDRSTWQCPVDCCPILVWLLGLARLRRQRWAPADIGSRHLADFEALSMPSREPAVSSRTVWVKIACSSGGVPARTLKCSLESRRYRSSKDPTLTRPCPLRHRGSTS